MILRWVKTVVRAVVETVVLGRLSCDTETLEAVILRWVKAVILRWVKAVILRWLRLWLRLWY